MVVELTDLSNAFKKAMILDFENKTVIFLRNGNFKAYSPCFFEKIVQKTIDLDKIYEYAEQEFLNYGLNNNK